MKIKTNLALFFLLFCGLVVVGQNLEINPAEMQFNAAGGELQYRYLNLRNKSDVGQAYLITTGELKLKNVEEQRSCKEWLVIEPSYIFVPPKSDVTVKIGIKAPKGTKKSSWALVKVSPAKENKGAADADRTISVGFRMNSILAIKVYYNPSGEGETQVEFVKFLKSQNKQKISLTGVVKNTGNTKVECNIQLVFSNLETGWKKEVAPVPFKLWPGTVKELYLDLPNDLPAGKYSVAALVDYGREYNLLGRELIVDIK